MALEIGHVDMPCFGSHFDTKSAQLYSAAFEMTSGPQRKTKSKTPRLFRALLLLKMPKWLPKQGTSACPLSGAILTLLCKHKDLENESFEVLI